MSAFRSILAMMALVLAVPAGAQDNAVQTAPPAETVGPRELENFSLEGRVTRPAEEETARPAQEAVPAAPPRNPREETSQRSENTAPDTVTGTRSTRPAPDELASRPLPAPTPASPPPGGASTASQPPRAPLVVDAPQEQGSSLLVWLAALLFAGGAGALFWYLRQSKGRPVFAGGYRSAYASPTPAGPEPAPVPKPLPRTVAPAPAATPVASPPKHDVPVSSAQPAAAPTPKTLGIVATSLRPWIDVELTPDRALVDDNGAAIAFNVTLVNSGSAPARDVSIEACLLNAGARQDDELSEFYQRPKKSSDSIPVIAPMARVPLRTAVKIPRDMIHEYEVEGRKLFMPMVAVSTRYRWSSGEGQTGASFLVGKGKEEQERLAPLRVDQGVRSWNGLGARRYEKGLRR